MSVFGQKEAMGLFQSLGIYTKDKNGYVYPYSEQAASVREAFETEILSNPSKERGRFFDKGKRTARSVRTEYRKAG